MGQVLPKGQQLQMRVSLCGQHVLSTILMEFARKQVFLFHVTQQLPPSRTWKQSSVSLTQLPPLQPYPPSALAIPNPEMTAGAADHLQLWKPPGVLSPIHTGAPVTWQVCPSWLLHTASGRRAAKQMMLQLWCPLTASAPLEGALGTKSHVSLA